MHFAHDVLANVDRCSCFLDISVMPPISVPQHLHFTHDLPESAMTLRVALDALKLEHSALTLGGREVRVT